MAVSLSLPWRSTRMASELEARQGDEGSTGTKALSRVQEGLQEERGAARRSSNCKACWPRPGGSWKNTNSQALQPTVLAITLPLVCIKSNSFYPTRASWCSSTSLAGCTVSEIGWSVSCFAKYATGVHSPMMEKEDTQRCAVQYRTHDLKVEWAETVTQTPTHLEAYLGKEKIDSEFNHVWEERGSELHEAATTFKLILNISAISTKPRITSPCNFQC